MTNHMAVSSMLPAHHATTTTLDDDASLPPCALPPSTTTTPSTPTATIPTPAYTHSTRISGPNDVYHCLGPKVSFELKKLSFDFCKLIHLFHLGSIYSITTPHAKTTTPATATTQAPRTTTTSVCSWGGNGYSYKTAREQ